MMSLCRYEGWVVVRTLQVSERRLYLIRSIICSQWNGSDVTGGFVGFDSITLSSEKTNKQ